MLHTISSKELKITFSDEFGEISSVLYKGRPVLKDPAQGNWLKSWPIMFPICGKVFDGKYKHMGKVYEMNGHGFFRSLKWDVKLSDNATSLVAKANNAASFKNIYPFDFGIQLDISIKASSLSYRISVFNNGNGDMFYNTGHHQALLVDLKKYAVELDHEAVFKRYSADGKEVATLASSRVFSPKNLDFSVDCSYQSVNSGAKGAVLKSGLGYSAKLDFPELPILTFWNRPGGSWLCIEPWNGNQDLGLSAPGEISQKKNVLRLAPQQSRTSTFSIAFGDE